MTTRFVALGDSVTEGLGDPLPGGGWRGYARLLADSLGPREEVLFGNLAGSGATSRDLAADQLPLALAFRPTLACVLAGVNDTLRGDFGLAGIAADLDAVVGGLSDAGATVMTARLPDPGLMLGVPDLVRRPLTRRVRAINAVLDRLADRYGTVHVDLASHPALYERRMWGVDRLHPSERGHRLLARLFAAELAARGVAVRALPAEEPAGRDPSAWASVRWMAVEGTGWLARRSRDFLPRLGALVVREAWYAARGRTAALDERFLAELEPALRRLPPVPAREPQHVPPRAREISA
ncbi:SGNH/GDSL hydrolase family protein [Microbispora sp. RL4-1S]|uniref:SGNH/GDSL hydrolase family protein n=1 Tax=Microbispora oryzae TaxID=2806554 RepID=A0A940WCY4_9ACTN|nr:SGNH/GDSL hydrolase family protein [Microbispora oryzae]MBP2703190.1 SGNH/GDSL hydrolase family protein [Microbispora oryzae]